jgi:hypothetical protein
VAATRAAYLAQRYLLEVEDLKSKWRTQLNASLRPRRDAAAVIDALPGHPVITIAIAAAATGRTRPAISQAIDQLVMAGVLEPISEGRRNRSWEGSIARSAGGNGQCLGYLMHHPNVTVGLCTPRSGLADDLPRPKPHRQAADLARPSLMSEPTS